MTGEPFVKKYRCLHGSLGRRHAYFIFLFFLFLVLSLHYYYAMF